MTTPSEWAPIYQLAGLLGISSGAMLLAVKFMLGTQSSAMGGRVDRLREHIDGQIDAIGERIDKQETRLDAHTQQLHNQELALLKQRNEMLESMRDRSVSREEFAGLNDQLRSIDKRLEAMRGNGQ